MKKLVLPILAIAVAILILRGVGGNHISSHGADGESRDPATKVVESTLATRHTPNRNQARRIWESPLIKRGIVSGVASEYHEFIAWMNLETDDHKYFISLLSERALIEATHDMRWAKADHGVRKEIDDQLETTLSENSALIRQFLNSEEDFHLFLKYESELPERKALVPFQNALDLTPQQETGLIELMKNARSEVESESGYEFEDSRFLRKHQDLELLKNLRTKTDLKIESGLREVLNSRQSEVFLDKWKSIREEQFKQSEFTAQVIRNEDS